MNASEVPAESNEDTLILRLFDERPEESVGRRAQVWLLDPTGEHVSRTCELGEEKTIIGRHPDCAISLPSSTVSRRHAEIRAEGSHFFLTDLSSTNGTLLNREPVIGEELLHDRDEIGVGIYRLIFRYL
jgi:predicted component of type VI protein secretion system